MLKPNHIKALSLLKDNLLPVKDVALACGFTEQHLYQLIEGNVSNAGDCAALFEKEYRKVRAEVDKKTGEKVKTFMERLVEELLQWNASLPKDPAQLNLNQVKVKKEIFAELNKFNQTRLSIGEFHYHTGMTGEDIVNEFKRIKSLVEFAARGGRVPSAGFGGSGEVPLGLEGILGGSKAEEASDVPSEPKAGEVPPEQGPRKGRPRRKSFGQDNMRDG